MAQFEIHKLSNMEPQEIDLELMGMSWSEKAVDIGEMNDGIGTVNWSRGKVRKKREDVLQEIMCSMCSGCQEDFLSDGASQRLIILDGVGSSWKKGSELLS